MWIHRLPIVRGLANGYVHRHDMTPARAWRRQKADVRRFVAALRHEEKTNQEVQALMQALKPKPAAAPAAKWPRQVYLDSYVLVLTPKGFYHASVFYSAARLGVASLQFYSLHDTQACIERVRQDIHKISCGERRLPPLVEDFKTIEEVEECRRQWRRAGRALVWPARRLAHVASASAVWQRQSAPRSRGGQAPGGAAPPPVATGGPEPPLRLGRQPGCDPRGPAKRHLAVDPARSTWATVGHAAIPAASSCPTAPRESRAMPLTRVPQKGRPMWLQDAAVAAAPRPFVLTVPAAGHAAVRRLQPQPWQGAPASRVTTSASPR